MEQVPDAHNDSSNPTGLGLLGLLQLTSPSFPVGAFAYSQGLEQAVERGWVSDAASLVEWLRGLLMHTLAETDLPLLRAAFDAFSAQDEARAWELSRFLLALRETRELRAEERQMGSSLARVLKGLGVERASAFVGNEHASYVVLFALGAHAFGIMRAAALQGYAFAWAENQVIGATRLFSLGQTDAHRALLDLARSIPGAVRIALGVATDEVGRSACGQCLASAWHEEQYSRLFRS